MLFHFIPFTLFTLQFSRCLLTFELFFFCLYFLCTALYAWTLHCIHFAFALAMLYNNQSHIYFLVRFSLHLLRSSLHILGLYFLHLFHAYPLSGFHRLNRMLLQLLIWVIKINRKFHIDSYSCKARQENRDQTESMPVTCGKIWLCSHVLSETDSASSAEYSSHAALDNTCQYGVSDASHSHIPSRCCDVCRPFLLRIAIALAS